VRTGANSNDNTPRAPAYTPPDRSAGLDEQEDQVACQIAGHASGCVYGLDVAHVGGRSVLRGRLPDREANEQSPWGWLFYRGVKTGKSFYRPMICVVHESRLIKVGLVDGGADAVSQASDDLKFAAAVAGFGMLLGDSPHKGSLTYDVVLELASSAASRDPQGYRREFLTLVRKAQMLSK
jgi:hypothetical protein